MIFRGAPVYPAETPLRKVCNVFRMNFLSRLLRDVKGVGCRIEKDWRRGGYGWKIIVDGQSTDETPPGWENPFNAILAQNPWNVTYADGVATVTPGLRTVIGGANSVEPASATVSTTGPAWIIKQYSGALQEWISGVQSVVAMPVDDAVANDIDFALEFYELYPDTVSRQRRVLAYISSGGVVTQYAYGTIYAAGIATAENEEPGGGEDVPEDDADAADECDQNTHPGDDGFTGGGTTPEDPPHPGDPPPDDPDPDHPGNNDCYTTT